MDKLAEIMAWKRTEVAQRARPVTEFELARISAGLPRPPSFAAALRRADGALAVIAEIKRRSPSAGEISAAALAPDQALRYSGAGADALSILTDGRYFGGTLEDLRAVSAAVPARYYIAALRGVLLKGNSLVDLAPQVMALGGFAVGILTLAVAGFRRTLG